jgi:lipid-binding SYLF domain-containing protein
VLIETMNTPEQGIPRSLLEAARCVAVIPGVKKVGFGFGGRYGRGLVSCRTAGGWSRPSFVAISGGSFGLQLGGQSSDLLLVFVNRKAAKRLSGGSFLLGGDASVSAGPVGRTGEAGTDVTLKSEIYSYSRSRGLFAGISLEGSTLTVDRDANADAYGGGAKVSDLLFGRGRGIPPELLAFVRRLGQYGS